MIFNNQEFFKSLSHNPRDYGWIAVYFLLFILVYYSILQSQSLSSYGNIYSFLFLIGFVVASVALVTNNKFFGFLNYGTTTTIDKLRNDIIIGLVFGGVLVLGYASSSSLLSWFSPPILVLTGAALTASLSSLVVVGFIGPLIEELSTQSVMNPTLINFLQSGSELPIIFFFGGIVFLLIIPQVIVSIVLFVLAAITTFNPNIKQFLVAKKSIRFFSSFIITGFAFSIFHIFAFGNFTLSFSLFASAFMFSIVDSILNWHNGTTTSGETAHITYNGFVFSLVQGIPLQLPLLLLSVYLLIKYIVFKYSARLS